MSSRYQPHLEFANFTCKFGTEENLADYLGEIVVRAFLDGSLKRTYTGTNYFFNRCRVVELENGQYPVIGIAGQFVKDTKLRRDQIYRPGEGVVHDEMSIDSAPTAFFILILNNHKLLYLQEVPGAPSLRSFKSTALKFLRTKHDEFIRGIYEERKDNGEKTTLLSVWEEHPGPTLEVIPLANEDGLEAFVHRFRQLRTVKVDLIIPNDEVDNDPLFYDEARSRQDRIGSQKTTIQHYHPKGLEKDVALEQLKPVALSGNAVVTLSGVDLNGDSLSGGQDDFKLRVPQSNLPDEDSQRVSKLYESYLGYVRAGTIRLQEVAESTLQKIKLVGQQMMNNDVR